MTPEAAGDDGAGRLAYLESTRDLLWPGGSQGAAVDMVILPARDRARLFAPIRPRRAAASAVLRYAAGHDRPGRAKAAVLAGGLRVGLIGRRSSRPGSAGPGPDSIDRHLGTVLGQPVLTSLALTHNRANRKPVLQVFDRSGHTLAFAKIGTSELTRRLVTAEATALHELARHDFRHVVVPAVLDHGRWNGLDVLVMSALPAWPGRAAGPHLLRRAMGEVAASGGRAGDRPTRYLDALRARRDEARATADAGHLRRWSELFDAEREARDNTELTLGAWHGDWARWNFVARGGRLALWDWERYGRPVPMGFDALHYFLQGHVGPRRDRFATGAPLMISQAPQLLADWDISPRAARTTALLYVLDIALRYLADDQRRTGGGGAIEQWAFTALAAALDGA